MKDLSHIGKDGRPSMVDVSGKQDMLRTAKAIGFIKLQPETLRLISDNNIKKGNVLVTAEIAGVMGAKQTSALIPLCHPLNTTVVRVKAELKEEGIEVTSEVSCIGRTGVEMEALCAINIALLTVYDMCKAVDKSMEITNIRLLEKIKTQI